MLQRLQADDGLPAEASDVADLARQLQGRRQSLRIYVCLQQGGIGGLPVARPGQFRTDAPWPEVFAAAKADKLADTCCSSMAWRSLHRCPVLGADPLGLVGGALLLKPRATEPADAVLSLSSPSL